MSFLPQVVYFGAMAEYNRTISQTTKGHEMNAKAQVAEIAATTVDIKNDRVAVYDRSGDRTLGHAVRTAGTDTFLLVSSTGATEMFWYSDVHRVELRPLDYEW